MKIKVQIDNSFNQMEIHVCNNEMNQQVTEVDDSSFIRISKAEIINI